jgi:hypothetical protein
MLMNQQKQLEEQQKQNERTHAVIRQPQEKTYKCPECAEWIKAEAKICRYCRSKVGETFAAQLAEEKRQAELKEKQIQREIKEAQEAARKKLEEEEAPLLEKKKADEEWAAEVKRRYEEEAQAKKDAKAKRNENLKKFFKSN